MIDLAQALAGKWEDGTRPADIFREHVAPDPAPYVAAIIDGLVSGNRRVQNGCAELASLLAEKHPELLLGHVDLFEQNLASPEKVIRWEAVCATGYLASKVPESRAASWVPTLIPYLRADSIVLQGHTLRALARIGATCASESKAVFDALDGATDAFPGNRLGFVAEAMAILGQSVGVRQDVRRFLERLTGSGIRIVARKATKALRQLPR